MVIKLNSLSRWKALPASEGIAFNGNPGVERRVRLHLNLEAVTTLFIGTGATQRLLCTAGPGLETIEFNAPGDFHVYAEKGSGVVSYQSADLEPIHSVVIDPKIFTRIANRRHRNPELEEIMYRMQLNTERRLEKQAGEFNQALERRIKEIENGRPIEKVVSDAPGTPNGDGGKEIQPQSGTGKEPGDRPTKPDESKSKSGTTDPKKAGGNNTGAE